MQGKTVSVMMLSLLVVSALALAVNVQPVKSDYTWTETIYIWADGSIQPPTAPISSVDNVTYTLTDNIAGNVPNYSSAIIIQRDNIIVDGAGHTLQGIHAEGSEGIDLTGRSNVTIENVKITTYGEGIYLYSSNNNSVSGNSITNNGGGLYLDYSSNNSVSGNNITANNGYGIVLQPSSNNNSVSGNYIANNGLGDGVFLYSSNNNDVSANSFVNDGLGVFDSYGNVVTDNLVNGKPLVYLEEVSDYAVGDAGQVILVKCNNITVENLNLSNTLEGVELWETNSTTISGNNITNDGYGLYLYSSSNNSVSGNSITNNGDGLYLYSSSNNSMSGNNITANNGEGIMLDHSSNNSVSGNNITNNGEGIWLIYSSINRVSGNNIANNWEGIEVDFSSSNTIYHDNFMNNTSQAISYDSTTVWDNGYSSGGNYWSDYTGVDTKCGPSQDHPGSDGIGDTPYVVDSSNQDNYPLMNPWTPPAGHNVAVVSVVPSKTVILQGFSGNITVYGVNKGEYPETFNVTVYANNIATANVTSIGTFINVTLAAGTSTNLTLVWNTTGFARGNYSISAYALPVPSEANTTDNNFTDGWVVVSLVGDLTGGTSNPWAFVPDGKVDGKDIAVVAVCYGSAPGCPSPYIWNPNSDVNNDAKVDGKDIALVAAHYGQAGP